MKIGTPLLGRRIIVRDYMPEDLSFCTDMWFDPVNGHYLSDPTREYVDETYQKALNGMQNSADGYYLIVELQGSGERIGTCCAFPENEVYDIGYCVRRDHWKQGYGTELVKLLVSWVQEQGGIAVTAEAARENLASCVLLEKCGFRDIQESSFKKYHMGVQFDSMIYQKTL